MTAEPMQSLYLRLQAWLYENDPRLHSPHEQRALGEAIGALGVNVGALMGIVLLDSGEAEYESLLDAFVQNVRSVAVRSAMKTAMERSSGRTSNH